jgi:hypothetical protein
MASIRTQRKYTRFPPNVHSWGISWGNLGGISQLCPAKNP